MRLAEVMRRLKPFGPEIISWAYHQAAADCRQHGILPVWICLPGEAGASECETAANLVRVAQAAGFMVINLCDVYERQKKDYVRLAPWDHHPNARGHRLIADRLYQALRDLDGAIPLGLSTRAERR
jgi:hypothetical protein